MKITRSLLILGVAVIALAIGVTVARTRAVQDWYDTVTVQGKMTAYLLDDGAAVNGLLLDGGQQIRLGPRLGAAIASRVKKGDLISVAGHGGHPTPFGRFVDAHAVTINGQTLTLAGEPEAPPDGPRGRGGRGPDDGLRGTRDGRGGPPAPAGRGDVDAPPPVPVESTTVHGTANTFLVGPGGEVRGLVLETGEQVRFPPRVGETLAAQKGAAHPEVTVVGQVVRGEYGIIVRAAQLTVGLQTILVR